MHHARPVPVTADVEGKGREGKKGLQLFCKHARHCLLSWLDFGRVLANCALHITSFGNTPSLHPIRIVSLVCLSACRVLNSYSSDFWMSHSSSTASDGLLSYHNPYHSPEPDAHRPLHGKSYELQFWFESVSLVAPSTHATRRCGLDVLLIIDYDWFCCTFQLLDCLGDPSFASIARRASTTIGGDGSQVYSKFPANEDLETGCGSGADAEANGDSGAVAASASCKSPPSRQSSYCSPACHNHELVTATHVTNPIASSGANQKSEDGLGVGAGTVALLVSTLHRGSLSYHSQGLCNVGGGSWSSGRVSSVWASGRPSSSSTWSPVSGGAFDSCQCEDSGGLF